MAEGFQPGTGVAPATLVELSVSCRILIDADVFSKSNPMVVMFVQDSASRGWKEFGRTEIIWNNLNPDFVKKFILNYFFEQSQKLKFEVYDIDSDKPDLKNHDFLGRMECTLGEIVSSNKLAKPLDGPRRDSGKIVVGAEELTKCKEQVTIQFNAHYLDKKHFFGKSDPFLSFSLSNEDGSYTLVHRTEVIKRTLNPTWRPFTLSVRSLCNGDYDRSIKVECHDWDADGGHYYIGSFITSLRELAKGPGTNNIYDCVNEEKAAKKGKKYVNSGQVQLMCCEVETVYTFLDYIRGGTHIHCTFAVDFTASNGDPKSPNSLYYMNPYRPNPYGMAIKSVGDIIQDYDTHKKFKALGFGGMTPDGVVPLIFALNGNSQNPYCEGIDGVLEAYNKTLHSVQRYGPADFARCVGHVAQFAEAARDGNDYFILLIVTDGIITDMPHTTEAIVRQIDISVQLFDDDDDRFISMVLLSRLPLSIIIVGVGEADFDAMEVLDGDEVRLTSWGVQAARDIVQFVPMRDFLGRNGEDAATVQARLAKEVLKEIPDQFLSYMQYMDIKPKPPLRSVPQSEQ